MKDVNKYIKCKKKHLQKTKKNNKELYKKFMEYDRKITHNMSVDFSSDKLVNMIKRQIKKEKNDKKLKDLHKSLKITLKLQKKSLKIIKSNPKKYKITRQDKLVQSQWMSLLNSNDC